MHYVICWGQDKVTMVIVASYILQFNSLYATDLKRGFRKVDKGLKERHGLNFLSTTEEPLISENCFFLIVNTVSHILRWIYVIIVSKSDTHVCCTAKLIFKSPSHVS